MSSCHVYIESKYEVCPIKSGSEQRTSLIGNEQLKMKCFHNSSAVVNSEYLVLLTEHCLVDPHTAAPHHQGLGQLPGVLHPLPDHVHVAGQVDYGEQSWKKNINFVVMFL